MARQVNHLSDIPDTRKFGSKYGGRKFKRHNWSWGYGAKSRLKSQGNRLKRQGRISNYRLASYENVAVTKENRVVSGTGDGKSGYCTFGNSGENYQVAARTGNLNRVLKVRSRSCRRG